MSDLLKRYWLGLAVIASIWSSASSVDAGELLPPDRPIAEVIDQHIGARLDSEGVSAAPQANDATLIRRLTLDLTGRTPTVQEARSYVESKDPQKRAHLVERLLGSPLYLRHAATELNTMLKGPDGTGPDLRDYLLVAMKENRSWDGIFRDLVGVNHQDGWENGEFYSRASTNPDLFVSGRIRNPDVLTRDASAIFFGINVTCCQCHTHPYIDTLTRDYYHGMKGFFSRTYDFEGKLLEKTFGQEIAYETGPGETKEVGLMFLTGAKSGTPELETADLGKSIAEENKGIEELRKKYKESAKLRNDTLALVTKKEEEKKKLLESEATQDKADKVAAIEKEISMERTKAEQVAFNFPENASYSYRDQLVSIALSQENEDLFARSIVNRLWHRLFGYGLVMRIDQMHGGNPGSHPELLEWLARDMKTHGYDLRRLLRGIVSSLAYSRSTEWDPDDPTPPAKELFAVANLRALTPLQFGVSVLLCGDPAFPPAAEALNDTMAGVEKTAREKFGAILQEPRDDFEISADEALGISNEAARLEVIGAKLVPELLKIQERPKQIETAVWSVLSRSPTVDEQRILAEYVDSHAGADGAKLEGALQQVVWALTTSAEFRFNH